MQDDTIDALTDLVERIEAGDYHVSSVNADEYLAGAGFDPDEVMGTEVTLTVHIPGTADDEDDNQFRIK